VAGNTLLRSTSGKVVVLGDIFVDVALRVPYYPEEGFDAMAREIDIRQGGSSTATSIVLSKLGIKSRVLGRVGDDPLGDIVLGLLEESGISTECIQRDMNNRTGLLFAVVSDHGERTMFAYRGANDYLSGSASIESDWLHVSGYSLLNSPQREFAQSALERAYKEGIPASLDPGVQSCIDTPELVKNLLKYVDVAFPSLQEIKQILPNEDPYESAHMMTEYGVPIVALKLGGEGSYLIDTTHSITAKIPAFQVAVIDTTGAGDSYDGGFIAGRLSGLNTVQSCILGSAAAANVIQRGCGVQGFCSGPTGVSELVSIIRSARDDERWEDLRDDLAVVESVLITSSLKGGGRSHLHGL